MDKQPYNADRIIAILSERIKTLELDKAFLLDELMTLREGLTNGDKSSESIQPSGDRQG